MSRDYTDGQRARSRSRDRRDERASADSNHPAISVTEAEQWGYAAKPYIPPVMHMHMPILSNPMVQPIMSVPMPSMSHHSAMVTPLAQGGHVVIENVPPDLNIMSLLYEHFKQFGEVVSIHCIPKYNKALIDFKTKDIADTATGQPVLGVPSIRATSYTGPARGPGSARAIMHGGSVLHNRQQHSMGVGGAPGVNGLPLAASPGGPSSSAAPSSSVKLTKNLVFESDAAKKAREKREKQDELDKKRKDLLVTYTTTVQQIVGKLSDKSIPEETRTKYQSMLETVKRKINEIQQEDNERKRKEAEAARKAMAVRYSAYLKQARIDSGIKQQQMTLDLRSRCVKISNLPEELAQSIVLVEYLKAMGIKELDDIIWLGEEQADRSGEEVTMAAVLRFVNHAAAEQLIKHELAFTAEWVPNETAKGLANYHQVEKIDPLIFDQVDDEDQNEQP